MTTQRYTKDKLQLAQTVISGAAVLALSVGAWFFNDLTGTVKGLDDSVDKLRTQVEVLAERDKAVAELRQDLRELKAELAKHANRDAHQDADVRIEFLERRVTKLEEGK